MAWDDVKATGNEITADEWNAHVVDQKSRGFDSIEVFEADGTFDATGVSGAYVEVVGGGGGSAGVTGLSGNIQAGGGGGGGGYAADYVDLTNTNSVAVTVGKGGAGGSSGDNDGSSGSASSFGTSVEAAGGGGGKVEPSGLASGGSGVFGSVQIAGGDGGDAIGHTGATNIIAPAPSGGGTQLSPSTRSQVSYEGSALTTANSGIPYGAGASGPLIIDASISEPGETGADGIVLVHY